MRLLWGLRALVGSPLERLVRLCNQKGRGTHNAHYHCQRKKAATLLRAAIRDRPKPFFCIGVRWNSLPIW